MGSPVYPIQDQDRFTFVTFIRQVSCFILAPRVIREYRGTLIIELRANYYRVGIFLQIFSTAMHVGNLAF